MMDLHGSTALLGTQQSYASSEYSKQSGRSFSRTITTSSGDTYSEIIPENLSFEELGNTVESLLQGITQLELENHIFQTYLEHHSPELIADMDEILEAMNNELLKLENSYNRRETIDTDASYEDENEEITEVETMEEKPEEAEFTYEEDDGMIMVKHKIPSALARQINISSTLSIRKVKSLTMGDSFYQRQQVANIVKRRLIFTFERCPRMNFTQRIDITEWATELQGQRLKAAVERATLEGGLLRAQIDSTDVRITEMRTILTHFHAKFKPSLFSCNKPLYADNFIKDIRDTVLNQEAIIERLQLKMGQLKCYRRRLLADLAQKRELSESIRPVDIETLKIENVQLTQQIALKTKYVNDLKTFSGLATQKVNSNKKRLAELSQTLKNLQNDIERKRNYISEMNQEEVLVVHEALKAERALTKIRLRVGKLTSPDVSEYVQLKHDISELAKEINSLERRYYKRFVTATALQKSVKYLERQEGKESTYEKPRKEARKSEFPKLNQRKSGEFRPPSDPVQHSCLKKVPKKITTCPPSRTQPPSP